LEGCGLGGRVILVGRDLEHHRKAFSVKSETIRKLIRLGFYGEDTPGSRPPHV